MKTVLFLSAIFISAQVFASDVVMEGAHSVRAAKEESEPQKNGDGPGNSNGRQILVSVGECVAFSPGEAHFQNQVLSTKGSTTNENGKLLVSARESEKGSLIIYVRFESSKEKKESIELRTGVAKNQDFSVIVGTTCDKQEDIGKLYMQVGLMD